MTDPGIQRLIETARAARTHARAPFSRFQVGAAIEDQEGRVWAGVNVESSSFGLTCCAERTALFTALTSGVAERTFRRIAVVTDVDKLTPPCGACRQVLWDYCGDIEVVLANLHGAIESHRLSVLLPHAFDKNNLA